VLHNYHGAVVRLWIPVVDEIALCHGSDVVQVLVNACLRRIKRFLANNSAKPIYGLLRTQQVKALGLGAFEINFESRPSARTMIDWGKNLCTHVQRPLRVNALPFVLYPKVRIGIDLPKTFKKSASPMRAQCSLDSATTTEPVCIYQEAIQRKKLDQLQLESEIRRGLKRHEFISYFQPKVDPETRSVAGAEALVRWHKPGHGILLPREFLHVAEQSELIHEIGKTVADQTINLLDRLVEKGKEIPVSINLSDRDLDHDSFIPSLKGKLQARNIDAQLISFEVSEKIAAIKNARHTSFFTMIRRAGFELALDDFGTSYSSLARLTRFPIREIKFDRDFISQAKRSSRGMNLLVSIGQMLLQNDYRVTIEGIEKPNELQLLKALPGCLVQGFYFSPAVPSRDLERLL